MSDTLLYAVDKDKSQNGINIVDLMMWLVIAALMLATAIQGIGYYQKAAYMHQMKFDLAGAGSNVMSLATGAGVVDKGIAEQALAESSFSVDVGYAVEETSADDMPYLRATHPAITDKDVIYLFEHCGPYAVGINVVPKDGNPILDACGISSTPAEPEPVVVAPEESTAPSFLASWGEAGVGALGVSTSSNRNRPGDVNMTTGLQDKRLTKVTAGLHASCALADTTVYCWGYNNYGQLGIGSTTDTSNPTQVQGLLAGKKVTQVDAGWRVACAIADGEAYCWGGGAYGQLGDGSTVQSSVPVKVAGPLAGKTVTDISVGGSQACAVADGAAYCWGEGTDGRIGDGGTNHEWLPVAVATDGVLAGKTVTDISTGASHSCAVASGKAYCWGAFGNYKAELGIGAPRSTVVDKPMAVVDSGALTGKTVTAIDAGVSTTCAIASGAAYCWGSNAYGSIGDNTTTDAYAPVAVDTSGSLAGKTITDISTSGGIASCAIADGELSCWGTNQTVRLGIGSTDNTLRRLVPTPVDTSGILSGKKITSVSIMTHALVSFE